MGYYRAALELEPSNPLALAALRRLTHRAEAWESLVEALRWDDPELGRVPPDRFIPLAEETGLILPVGRWVLQAACQEFAQWRSRGLTIPRLAINVSAVQVLRGDLVAEVARVLADTGLSPDLLELEVTEAVFLADTKRAVAVLQDLRDMGVHLAVDDFGTGYSSLAYLKQFPVERLKIDQSFVRDMLEDPNDRAIAEAVIALGKSLGMRVIAEGIESLAHADELRSKGCDEAQGYYYSRPMPGPAFGGLLETTRSVGDFIPAGAQA